MTAVHIGDFEDEFWDQPLDAHGGFSTATLSITVDNETISYNMVGMIDETDDYGYDASAFATVLVDLEIEYRD